MIRSAMTGFVAGLLLATGPARAFTEDARVGVLDHIAGQIEEHYVFEDKAKEIAGEIRSWKSDQALMAAPDERSFAALLTARLAPKDAHFSVEWSPPDASKSPEPDAAGIVARINRRITRENYGFEKLERLPGNIGYIKMRFFADFDTALTGDKTPSARKVAEAALAFVSHSNAVIFDLRENGGGSPAMIDLLLSGFFGEKPVLLNRFLERKDKKTYDFTTLANFTGARRPDVPLYVLVSGSTASAAEEFAYDVQSQKRGLLVGQTTMGAANPGQSFDAGGGFSVFVSTGAAVNPITHTNWERVGVVPDVSVATADALTRAQEMALATVSKSSGPDSVEARWALERLDAEKNAAPLSNEMQLQYVGIYSDREIILENGSLVYRRGDRSPSHRIIHLRAEDFAVEGLPDFRLTFERGADGRITGMLIHDPEGGIISHPRAIESK